MVNRELLLQAKQRIEKLLEEQEKLEGLEFSYHTMCTLTDYSPVQDQKDLIEFLVMKLNNTLQVMGDIKCTL